MWLFLWKPGEFQLLGASGSPLRRGFCPRPKRSYGAKAPLTMWGAWSCPASILCGQDKKQAVESTPLGVRGPQCSVQRSLRVAAKAAPLNSLAHWASASLHPPLAALGSNRIWRHQVNCPAGTREGPWGCAVNPQKALGVPCMAPRPRLRRKGAVEISKS